MAAEAVGRLAAKVGPLLMKAGKAAAAVAAAKVGEKLLERAIEAGGDAVEARAVDRHNKRLAADLAKSIDGQYSERTVIAGQYRYVVWKNGKPMASFPQIDEASTPEQLAERFELRDFKGTLHTPPTS